MTTAPLQSGDTVTLAIDSLAFGGEGIGRHEGRAVFVPFTAIGDSVEVKVREVKKNFARADLVRVVTPGPERATPPCPYYTACGGCQYQHLTAGEEQRVKHSQVVEALRRMGKIAAPEAVVLPLVPSPQLYGYRNRITVHAAGRRIGFHRIGAREIVDIAHCLIAMPEVNEELLELRRPARRPTEGHFSLRAAGLPPAAFHQVNQFLLAPLRDLVAEWCGGPETRLVEGYCGGGFFTALLVEQFEKVWAIEADPRSLRDAHRIRAKNVEWIEGKVEERLAPALAAAADGPTLVLLDPPRDGLPPEAIAALLEHRPARIVYVSCSPATLARDVERLSPAYELVRNQPFDLFPRTAQIETVSELRLR